MPRTKYKKRPDGRRVCAKSYTDFGDFHYTGRKYFYGATDEEIDNKIAEWEKSQQRQNNGSVRTFKEVAVEWWAEKEKELSPNSKRGYKARMNYVVSELGDMPVNEITPLHIITMLRKVAAQDFSQKVIADRKSIAKSILDNALIAGEITSNPCIGLPIVKGKKGVHRLPASDEEIKKLESHKTDSMIARLSYFMLYTGCRRGEACALQQKDLDLKNKKASISKTLAYEGNSPIIKLSPKTDAGERDIDLYDNVIEILPHYDNPETYIFFPDGLPTEKQLESALKKFQQSIGITATAHQLRHNYATMLHSAKVDVKDAQHLLGHSSIVVTQDIYTELDARHKQEVRDQINDYIQTSVVKTVVKSQK